MASIIAEMEGYKFIAMMTPVSIHKTKEDVEREENEAISRVVRYHYNGNDQNEIKEMLERLKGHNNPYMKSNHF